MDLKKCLYCGNIIQFNSLRVSDYNKKKFCNNCCAASYNNRRRKKKKKYCLVCGKEVPLRNKFCSVQCYHYLQYSNYIKKWKSDQLNGMTGKKWKDLSSHIRRYLFEKYENKCARCGWSEINPYTGTLPLEVEHIDGDATNNREENLILLCPNCHSLTETYRGANKGNGTRNIKWLSRDCL